MLYDKIIIEYASMYLLVNEKTNTKWASVALLSIIIPVTLLASFRLTGIQPEPQTPQTITVETVSWNMTRPRSIDIIAIDERVSNSHVDDIASVNLAIQVGGYRESAPRYWLWKGGYDEIDLSVAVTANISKGFVYSIVIELSNIDAQADVIIIDGESWMQLHNLEIVELDDSSYRHKAWIEASSFGQPLDSVLGIIVFWDFFDQNIADHFMSVTAEVTYFNGSTWQKVTVPIQLGVLAS